MSALSMSALSMSALSMSALGMSALSMSALGMSTLSMSALSISNGFRSLMSSLCYNKPHPNKSSQIGNKEITLFLF